MALAFSNAAGVLVPEWFLMAVAAAVIGARLYLHVVIQRRPPTLSDYFMCCAWLLSFASSTFDVYFAVTGSLDTNDDNDQEATVENIEYRQEIFWIASFPYFTAFYFCKAALLAFYYQLFPPFMKKRRIVLWMVVAYTAAAWIITMVVNVSLCRDIRGYWWVDPKMVDEHCVPSSVLVLWLVTWTVHFSSDIMLFCLPFLVLYKLKLKRTVKYGVYGTFLLAAINLTIGLVRFLIVQIGTDNGFMNLPTIELLSALELNIALVIACLPSLRPYFGSSPGSSMETKMSLPSIPGSQNSRFTFVDRKDGTVDSTPTQETGVQEHA